MTTKEKRQRYNCRKCGSHTFAITNTRRFDQRLCSDCFGKRPDRRPKELNDLSGADWARFSLSVQEYPDTRTTKQKLHGACFPLSLAKQYILKYTKRDEVVLDPFVGVGTTVDACVELDRSCIGLELSTRFCKVAKADLPKNSPHRYEIINDDAEHVGKWISRHGIDFVLTSPPYATLLKNVKRAFAYKWKEHSNLTSINNPRPYSDRREDLGNMGYDQYFVKMKSIMDSLYTTVKPGKYMAWVVKDYRDVKANIPYVNFHGDLINCAEAAGFTLWDIVIYDQTKYRPLVCLGYPSSKYYHNIGHSYILIFRK